MKIAGLAAAILLTVLTGAWLAWRFAPHAPETRPDTAPQITVFGSPSGANLIGVQPWVSADDYRSAQTLRARFGAYLEAARAQELITARTVAIFPEHAGTWLVAANGPGAVYSADTVAGAMTALIAARPFAFARAWPGSREEDRAAAAVFRMNARRMARDYQSVFSDLAREYGVTIVAGSIVLPGPRVEDGVLEIDLTAPLYNVSAVFGPDGRIDPSLARKAYPIPSESPFTAASPAALYPVFDTPAGRLGVLICADSWHPDVYEALDAGGAEILAVPAYLQPSGVWDEPWGGYTTPWPDDAPRSDAGQLTEGEAWLAHALGGRMDAVSARAGLTTFLRGDLWDLGSDGRAIAADAQGVHLGAAGEAGALTILWLED